MSSTQDVRFSEERIAQGLQLTNKLWNAARLILLGVARPTRGPARRTRRPSRTAGSCRASSAPRPRSASGSRATTSPMPRSRSTTSSTASCATGISSSSSRGCAPGSPRSRRRCCTCSPRTLALAHPMIPFVTEEIYSYVPGADGLLAARHPQLEQRRSTTSPRRAVGRVIEAVAGDARVAGQDCRCRRRAIVPARLEADGLRRDRRAPRTARATVVIARRRGSSGERPGARRRRRDPPEPDVDLGAAERKRAARRAKLEREIERARAQARKPGVRREGAARGRRQGARPTSSELRAELGARCEPPSKPSATSSTASCSGCGSGSTACAGMMTALGQPERQFRLDPRGRDERQVLDGADDRGDSRSATACAPAPTCRRIWSRSASGSGCRTRISTRPSSLPRSSAPPTPPSWSTARSTAGERVDPVRAADRRRRTPSSRASGSRWR